MTALQEKRKFPRFPVTKPVICFRYGRQMTMRTLDMSLGGLKLEANFDLQVGESIDLVILTNGARIPCKGRILAIEDFKHKVHARLCFANVSKIGFQRLSNYLNALSRGKGIPFDKLVIGALIILSACIAYLIIHTYFLR
jgi:hypothetical protein